MNVRHSESCSSILTLRPCEGESLDTLQIVDVYSVNLRTARIELWTKSVTNGVDTSKFLQPELVHWQTFDKRTLSGFLYRPSEKFKGKRPVII